VQNAQAPAGCGAFEVVPDPEPEAEPELDGALEDEPLPSEELLEDSEDVVVDELPASVDGVEDPDAPDDSEAGLPRLSVR
jgi:hypothetical protein